MFPHLVVNITGSTKVRPLRLRVKEMKRQKSIREEDTNAGSGRDWLTATKRSERVPLHAGCLRLPTSFAADDEDDNPFVRRWALTARSTILPWRIAVHKHLRRMVGSLVSGF